MSEQLDEKPPVVHLARPPRNPDELWWTVKALWGVTIPRTPVCPGHVSPFDAFAEGYFGNDANIVLWYGSRGCLAADTLITVNRAGLGRKRPIGAFVHRLHGTYRHLGLKGYSGGKPYDPAIPTYVQRAEGDVARLGLLGNAWDSGVKQTYELVTDSGRRIRATAEHPFLLASGDYVSLGDLATGDEVRVNIGRSTRGRKVKQRYDRTTAKFHPHSSRGQYWIHRLVVEAHLNKMGFDDYMQRVNDPVMATSLSILPRNVHVHHRNHDHLDNRLDNLELVDPSTHHREHAYAGKMSHVLEQIGSERVTSIAKWHEPEPTYDLTLADDPHNYIANGFVVHNTGKSLLLALLALTKAALLEINVTLLGGSMAQSNNVAEHIDNLLLYSAAPRWAVSQQIKTQLTFSAGNWIRPLPASQRTVRGPHPGMTCLAGWTLVNTLDGDIPIEEITVGQRIWVSDDLATPRVGVVQRVIDQGWKETVNVHGDHGVITCTPDHEFHTVRGWVQAVDLQANDVLTVWQPSDWAQLEQNRTVPQVLSDMWSSREAHLRLWEAAFAGSDNLPGLLPGQSGDQCPEVSGLWLPVEAGQHVAVPEVPSCVDDHAGCAGSVCAGQGDGQGRRADVEGGGFSGSVACEARHRVSEAGSLRSVDHGFLPAVSSSVGGGPRGVLARSAEEPGQGLVEAPDAGGGGLLSVVPTHGREGVLVGGVVRRVEPGPRCHVFDITSDAGNFYANGVLIHNCLDEIDEMDRKVYDAAMGQAMAKPNARGVVVPEMVVASSTWQNPTGCLGVDTLVTTRRGVIPIQEVQVGDEVPTRHGWRKVTGSHNTGMQETLTVTFASGRRVTATPWHKFWTDSHGWVRADALAPSLHVGTSLFGLAPATPCLPLAHDAAHAPAFEVPVVTAGDPGLAQVMPVLAEDSDFLVDERPEVVFADADNLQVSRVDAVATPAQVVDVEPVGNRPVELHPDPAMGRDDALWQGSVGLDAVAVLRDAEGPADAVVGVEVDGVPFAEDEVVDVSHVPIVLPTWDLTVDGTHEYVANGILVHNTFQEVRDEFLAKGLPIRTWCFQEVLRSEGNPDGWMDPEFIERKRKAVPAEMFRVEYELGEPAGGSRAFDLEALNRAFVAMPVVSERHAGSDDEWVFEEPVTTGWYAVGADWAKEADRTVIVVARLDESVRRVVYVRCVNRRPWPVMAGMFNEVLRRYANVVAAHDGTGIGNVVNDLIDERALKFVMSGRKRSDMLTDYVSAVERGAYRLPAGTPLLGAHRATTVEDVYAPGKWNGHLPDEVAACALAHFAAEHGAPVASGVGVERSEYRPRATKELYPESTVVSVMGDVRASGGVVDDVWDFLVT